MFNEYDVVYSKEKTNEKVSLNTKGLIVMVLDEPADESMPKAMKIGHNSKGVEDVYSL